MNSQYISQEDKAVWCIFTWGEAGICNSWHPTQDPLDRLDKNGQKIMLVGNNTSMSWHWGVNLWRRPKWWQESCNSTPQNNQKRSTMKYSGRLTPQRRQSTVSPHFCTGHSGLHAMNHDFAIVYKYWATKRFGSLRSQCIRSVLRLCQSDWSCCCNPNGILKAQTS